MFEKFKYERVPLSLINLDDRNPRIVTQQRLQNADEIIQYFFEHEELASLLKIIASEGRNPGAERPYIIKHGKEYVVIEGNTRIAAYKLLTGQLTAPADFANLVPHIPRPAKEDLLSVDCSIAPSRDALLPIMARAHFGRGDKVQWNYLGSRKIVFDEWNSGKGISQLATVFDRKQPAIRDLIVEYKLYLEALTLGWTPEEDAVLRDPAVEFNPPVRFLQSSGHKSALGVVLDRVNLQVKFEGAESRNKFKHLIRKLVLSSERGLGATATYSEVFSDYNPHKASQKQGAGGATANQASDGSASNGQNSGSNKDASVNGGGSSNTKSASSKLKAGALFDYPVTSASLVIKQAMKEAKEINTLRLPAAGTALLRVIIEGILKDIIDDQGANKQNRLLSLETGIDIVLSNAVTLTQDDKRILKEFKQTHLNYVNLGAHATVVPNHLRLMSARDCIDQFVKRNV